MVRAELIFIPSPGVGHLISAIEFAKLLVSRDDRLSISILIMKWPFDTGGVADITRSLLKDKTERIQFVELPAPDDTVMSTLRAPPGSPVAIVYVEHQKTQARAAVAAIVSQSESIHLAGFVVDMFCTAMMDVADEFGLPSYVFFTSSAASLGLMFYVQSLEDDSHQDVSEYKDSDAELSIPSYFNPVPAKVLPTFMLSKEGAALAASIARRFRQMKGIVVNTVLELEFHAIESLARDSMTPAVYHVGPIINFKSGDGNLDKNSVDGIIGWLDDQPPSSVVFLCFGSMGSFCKEQVAEMARALELSGTRFLWSLRRPSQHMGRMEMSEEYEDFDEVLPEGFLERTSGVGKVIGWAPQVEILSHPAVGGFVSHCGWNSTLESIWCGVPMATWPMYAEQQINAFELVELGIAVEIKMDYRKEMSSGIGSILVTAEEMERGIRCLMDGEGEVRKKMKVMKDICRKATVQGESSYTSLGQFFDDILDNIPAGGKERQ